MAKITRTSAGTYTTRVYLGRDANGKQLFEYITRSTYKECRNAARKAEQKIADGKYSTYENMKAETAFDKWIELNEDRLSPTTVRVYYIYIERFKAHFTGAKLGRITNIHVQEFLKLLKSGGKLGDKKIKKQSNTSLLKQYCVLNNIFEEFLKDKNPCREVKAPIKDESERTILTEKQFKKVRKHIKGTREEVPIILAASCGMRLGEIFGLRWKDVDFKNGIIGVRQNMVKAGAGEYIIKSPKSKKGVRDIIASREAIKVLKEYQKKIASENGIVGSGELIIQNDRPDNCSKRYETLIKNLGLPKTRFHDLRHYRATRMLAAGIPDILASQQLGHYDVSMTKQYQHPTEDIVAPVKNLIKNLL